MLTNAPFGLRAAYHPSADEHAAGFPIASGYGVNIFKGDPVILATNGTVTAGTVAADLLGVFVGVEYTDITGKPSYSNFWPAGQTVQAGAPAQAFVVTDPTVVYEVQANGPVAVAAVGDQADMVAGSGNVLTGQSTVTLNSTLAGVGIQAQFRIVGFGLMPDNLPGDAFTVVRVQIARHQFVANKVAV